MRSYVIIISEAAELGFYFHNGSSTVSPVSLASDIKPIANNLTVLIVSPFIMKTVHVSKMREREKKKN